MKRVIEVPDDGLAGIARETLDAAIENFRNPAYRVELAAAVITVCLLARSRARLTSVPAMLVSFAAGKAARWAYESVEDIRAKVVPPPQLLFHGTAGCRGHEYDTGPECSDEAGDVRPG